ncbi:threonine--tRNA ligase [Candidatus Woesearchaeota archaeon]|nr:threonine--tRNA ligase [Candidatus Woesearchaeota archaeon]
MAEDIFKVDGKEYSKEQYWHTSSHILAQALQRLYPACKLTIGPAIENGFYYDIDNLHITEDDFSKIEAEMEKICKENLPVVHKDISKDEARQKWKDNKYKIELIEGIAGSTVSTYSQGNFTDLCSGPHLPSTGLVKAIKILKLAGAYWRGDAKNEMLTRVYAISFPDKKELKKYLMGLEEAKKRDHRILGRQLDWFSFHEYSPGAPFFHGKGSRIYVKLINWLRDEYRLRGYQEVITPLLYNKKLWETSGHWDHYKDEMFILNIDGQESSLKPMNCPSHLLIYMNDSKSYRDLPWRVADFAPVHRNELRGVLSGMVRVRKFSQDDAHVLCTEEQMDDEILALIDFANYIYKDVFSFPFDVELSTRPEKFMGSKEEWDKAEKALKNALEKRKIHYRVNEGDGAFYGPKIDFHIKDSLGRSWQLSTIQVDFQMPGRFGATYEGQDGQKHTPVMLHRALLGSIERFMAILIEHYAGKLPTWLLPVQVIVLPVADRHHDYATKLREQMLRAGLEVEVDYRQESIPKKVRNAQQSRIKYILVVGDNELKDGTVAVRTWDNIVHGAKKIDEFVSEVVKEIQDKK